MRWSTRWRISVAFRSAGEASLLGILIFIIMFIPGTMDARHAEHDIDAAINRAVNNVHAENIQNTVFHLENYGNRSSWEKQWEAAQWSAAELERYGLDVTIQTYEYKDKRWPNVIATLRGTTRADEIIILIAHLDSISDDPNKDAPGADDDGSGVAALIEIARILQQTPLARTVIICLFTNEERGAMGSKSFARNARQRSLDVRIVMNLDNLGYNGPETLAPLDAIESHRTFKHKTKALYRVGNNYLNSLFKGKGRAKIAGREKDSAWVKLTSRLFGQFAGLEVQEIMDNGCG